MQSPPPIIIEPSGPVRSSIIWLHGLGADGTDFVPIVPELGLSPDLGARFIFPNAPSIPVTINGGMVMPAWYDILEVEVQRRVDLDGVRKTALSVRAMIEAEREAGIPSNKIILAGFSQGGAITLFEGLRHPEPLAGLLALSTYLIGPELLAEEASEANSKTPILQCHGSEDPMIPIFNGEASRDQLQSSGYQIEWESYPMGHQVCLPEIKRIGAWLNDRLS